MEGSKDAGRKIAEDYLKKFDRIIHTIEKNALPASKASGLTDALAETLVKFINKGKFATKGDKIIPQGYSVKDTNAFMKTITKDLKIQEENAVALMD